MPSRSWTMGGERWQEDTRAGWAVEFACRWGMVAGIDSGEDSAGRSRTRLATVEEVVNRAVDMAGLLHDTLVSRGWLVEIPATSGVVEALCQAKELAVAKEDWEAGAAIRDLADKLKQKLEAVPKPEVTTRSNPQA